jgi:protease-4
MKKLLKLSALLSLLGSPILAQHNEVFNQNNVPGHFGIDGVSGFDYAYENTGTQELTLINKSFSVGMLFNERSKGFENYFLMSKADFGSIDFGYRLGIMRPHLPTELLPDESNFYTDLSLAFRSNDIFLPYVSYSGLFLNKENHSLRYGLNIRPFASKNFEVGVEFQDGLYNSDHSPLPDSASLKLSGYLFDTFHYQIEAPFGRLDAPSQARLTLGVPLGNLNYQFDHSNSKKYAHAFRLRNKNPLSPKGMHDKWHKLVIDKPFALMGSSSFFETTQGLLEWAQSIENAKQQDDINGLWIDVKVPLSAARTDQLLQTLKSLKSRNIKIWVSAENYGYSELLLASISDKSFIHPHGRFNYFGNSVEVWYYKELLDSLGIEFQVVRAGKYKNAMEPFVNGKMTESFKTEAERILASKQNYLISNLNDAKGITKERVHDHFILPDLTPQAAVERKYVDKIMSPLEIEKKLLKKTSGFIKVKPKTNTPLNLNFSKNSKIAVLPMVGTLVNGSSGSGFTGGTFTGDIDFCKATKEIYKDSPEALILLVESPGGSVLASEKMRDCLIDLKEKLDIPIYASIQGVAASGAALLLTAVDKIFVLPNSITGSIGVFMAKPNASKALKKIGINSQEVSIGQHANAWTLSKGLTALEEVAIQEYINTYYTRFKILVAESRGIDLLKMDSLAQGKVYTGLEAIEIKLADEIGGFQQTVDSAIAKVGSDKDHYSLIWYKSNSGSLINEMGLKVQSMLPGSSSSLVKPLQPIEASEWFHQNELISWSPWLESFNK